MKHPILFTFFFTFYITVIAQSITYDSLWNNPAVEKRITEGIEKNRKGDFIINFINTKGTEEVEIQHITHDFLFGANIFMLNGFKTEAENKRYETAFTSLFNLACVPFYWQTLEPAQGKPRFTAASAPIYRRPPPDAVLAFCEKYNITPKGHTLVWDHPRHSVPGWLPRDTAQIQPLIDLRIKQLAQRYGAKVQTWDVVNEVLKDHPDVPMPPQYPLRAFYSAQQHFPASTRLFINEVTGESWQNYHREYTPYALLIEHLRQKGAKIDGIGLQFHLFSESLHYDVIAGKAMRPHELFRALDLYAQYNVPLHVSEITIPTLPNNTAQGAENQAKLTRNFYRLWFSHPAVEAIIWWNLADGTAVAGEDKWQGGFLKEDLSPKLSYHVLNDLINKEWKTNIKKTLKNEHSIAFSGFYGKYKIIIKQGKKMTEKVIDFTKNAPKQVDIDIK